ncbi:hypothetical protein DYB31_004329 [Aphanomyces astaci]|uniref:Codanin-1 C-terminal domain-containing protein n=1 Tax=Aphanomyces astaci TaxID=112090 RepID=A0A397FD25_APHAT|nr:hypothetical protein DYB31_004329 [Aphanomyces astaci]
MVEVTGTTPVDETAFEEALGEAVWKGCASGYRLEIQQWILSRVQFYARCSSLVEGSSVREMNDLSFLELKPEHHIRQSTLTPDQLIYAYLNYLRVHFKSEFKDVMPQQATDVPPIMVANSTHQVHTPSTTHREVKGPKKRVALSSQPTAPAPSWTNQDFPPLGTSAIEIHQVYELNVLVLLGGAPNKPTKAIHTPKKPLKDKRRIRSTLLSTTPQVDDGGGGKLFTSAANIDVPLKKDVMAKFETRLMAPPSSLQEGSTPHLSCPQPSVESTNNHDPPPPDFDNAPDVEHEVVVLDEIDHTPSPAALLYSFLLQSKLAPCTTIELQWLFSLLVQKPSDNDPTSKQFAMSVLNTIPSWLEAYGVDILKLVIDAFQKARVATPLLDRFVLYLDQYEGDRATESQVAGAPLPIESEAIPSLHGNFALPFREDTDSRLHFRTPHESVVFTNREKARDGFLALLRSWQNAQSAIAVRRQEDVRPPSAVLDDLLVENHWWFAQLFVMELLQVAANPVGEHDHDLVRQIIHDDKQLKNADRLRKLHQRFTHVPSTQPQLTLEKPRDPSHAAAPCAAAASFPDNQRFFYDFLVMTNHFQFSSLVAVVLQSHLCQTLATFQSTSSSSLSTTAMRKQFNVKVLQAKLLGKFLGWLHYAPCWSSTPRSFSKHNAAMEAATREAIGMRNHVQVPLDIASYITTAVAQHTLMAHVPWVCEYMAMVAKDPVACATAYFRADVPTFRRFLQTIHQDDKQATSRKVKLRPLVVQEPSLLAPSLDTPPPSTPPSTSSPFSPKNRVESALTLAFYKQYPSVKPTIEFVVDTMMTNVCHFANTTLLQPAAAAFVDRLHATMDPTLVKDDQTNWISAQVRLHLPAAKAQVSKQLSKMYFMEKHLVFTRRHTVARMRKMKKESPPPTPISTASTALDRMYALSKLVLEDDPIVHLRAFADLVTCTQVTPVVLCCLSDTLPHIPLDHPSVVADVVRCIHHVLVAPPHTHETFAAASVTSIVSASLNRDKTDLTVQLIRDLCDVWPPLGGSIQAVLMHARHTHGDLVRRVYSHNALLFAAAMAAITLPSTPHPSTSPAVIY